MASVAGNLILDDIRVKWSASFMDQVLHDPFFSHTSSVFGFPFNNSAVTLWYFYVPNVTKSPLSAALHSTPNTLKNE